MNTADLTGRTAIITGAARGIGACTAQFLAKHGAEVIVADKDVNAAEETVDNILGARYKAYTQYLDVLDIKTIRDMVDSVIKKSGKIDILVNNAGVLDATLIPEMTLERWGFCSRCGSSRHAPLFTSLSFLYVREKIWQNR